MDKKDYVNTNLLFIKEIYTYSVVKNLFKRTPLISIVIIFKTIILRKLITLANINNICI